MEFIGHPSLMTVTCNPANFYSRVLALLLLIGGIEQNPGPVDQVNSELCGRLNEAEKSEYNELIKKLNERAIQRMERETELMARETHANLHTVPSRSDTAQHNDRNTQLSTCSVPVIENAAGTSNAVCSVSQAGSALQHSGDGNASALLDVCTVPDNQEQAEEKSSVSCSGSQTESALHLAAQHGRLEDAKALLSTGAVPVDQINRDGKTALHLAAAAGHEHMVRFLVLEGHADPQVRCNAWDTALSLAAQGGNLPIVQFLINKALVSPLFKYKFANTIAHMAAKSGHTDVLNWLLNNTTVQINNNTNYNKETVLHHAVIGGHLNTVKWLVENTVHTTAHRANAYHLALITGHLDIVEWLLEGEHVQFGTPNNLQELEIHLAARSGSLNLIRWCIGKGYWQVNVENQEKETALHVAVMNGHLNVVRCLIKEGQANVNAVDGNGRSVLYLAAERDEVQILNYLVKQANVNLKEFGSNALLAAAEAGMFDAMRYLHEEVGNIGVTFHYVDATIMNAIQMGNENMVRYLSAIAYVEFTSEHLHLAIDQGNLKLVECLIESGASTEMVVNCFYCEGGTALHHAARSGYSRIVKYIIEETDVNIAAANSKGRIAFEVAWSSDVKDLLSKCPQLK